MIPPRLRHLIAAFLYDFAFSSALTVTPFYVFEYLDGGAGLSGGILGIQGAAYTAACLLSGYWVRRMAEPMRAAVLGSAWFSLCYAVAPLTYEPALFGLLVSVAVVGSGCFWPNMQAFMSSERDASKRGRHIAAYNMAWCFGLAAGPLFAGPLYGVHHWLPFGLVGLTGLMASAFAASLRTGGGAGDGGGAEPGAPLQSARVLPAAPPLLAAWGANLAGTIMIGVMRGVFPKRLEDLSQMEDLAWAFEEPGSVGAAAVTLFALFNVLLYGIRIVVSFGMGRWQGWHGRFGWAAWAQIIGGGAFFVLGSTHSIAVMAVACAVVGMCATGVFFASLAYSVEHPATAHRNARVHESLTGAGNLLGGVGFGLLAEAYGIDWPFRWAPVLFVVLAAVQAAIVWRGRQAARPA